MFVDLKCEIVKITLPVTQIQACTPDPQALTIRNAHPSEHTHIEKTLALAQACGAVSYRVANLQILSALKVDLKEKMG